MTDKQEAMQAYVDAPAFWDSLTEQQQIQAAVCVFRALRKNAEKRGSFRCLLYNEFGWSAAAYSPIYCVGGMEINNRLIDSTGGGDD